MPMPVRSTPPRFDTGRTPADPKHAGQQPAADVWGIGKKTVERLREKLALDPNATPTVADFAYVNLDAFDVNPSQRALLQEQQDYLVNALHVGPEGAASPEAAALRAAMDQEISGALAAIASGTETKSFVQRRISEFASSVAGGYGIWGQVGVPSAEEVAKANAQGMKLSEGQVAIAVRKNGQAGAVVVPVNPRDLLEPVVVQLSNGSRKHSFTAAHGVKPTRSFVVEEPTEGYAKLRSLEAQARDAAAAVWIDADPTGRQGRLQDLERKIGAFQKAIGDESLGANQKLTLHGALSALRSIQEITVSMLAKAGGAPAAL